MIEKVSLREGEKIKRTLGKKRFKHCESVKLRSNHLIYQCGGQGAGDRNFGSSKKLKGILRFVSVDNPVEEFCCKGLREMSVADGESKVQKRLSFFDGTISNMFVHCWGILDKLLSPFISLSSKVTADVWLGS
jgi:hypothetical protein